MYVLLKILEVILATLYIGATVAYVNDFIKPSEKTTILCKILIRGIPVVHIIYLIIIAVNLQRIPVANFFEFLSALSLGLLVIYFYLEVRFKTRSLGPWIIGLAALFQSLVMLFTQHQKVIGDETRLFQSFWLAFHMIFGSLAFASLLISAIFSVMYLVLYRSLKQKKFGLFFERFLPLSVLGEMNYQAMIAGLVCLALMIPFGIGMVFQHYSKWIWDFKYLSVFMFFIIYLVGVLIGKFANWRGNRLAIYSLAGIIIMIVTTAISMMYSLYHKWG